MKDLCSISREDDKVTVFNLMDDMLGIATTLSIFQTTAGLNATRPLFDLTAGPDATRDFLIATLSEIRRRYDGRNLLHDSASTKLYNKHARGSRISSRWTRILRIANCAEQQDVYNELCLWYGVPDVLGPWDLLKDASLLDPLGAAESTSRADSTVFLAVHDLTPWKLPVMLLTSLNETKHGSNTYQAHLCRWRYFRGLCKAQSRHHEQTMPMLRYMLSLIESTIRKLPELDVPVYQVPGYHRWIFLKIWRGLALEHSSQPLLVFQDPALQWCRSLGFLDIDMWLALVSLIAAIGDLFGNDHAEIHTWCLQASHVLQTLGRTDFLFFVALYHAVSFEWQIGDFIESLKLDLRTFLSVTPCPFPELVLWEPQDFLPSPARSNSSLYRLSDFSHRSSVNTGSVSNRSSISASRNLSSLLLRKSWSSLGSTHLLGQRVASLISFSSKASSKDEHKEDDGEDSGYGSHKTSLPELDEDGDIEMTLGDHQVEYQEDWM